MKKKQQFTGSKRKQAPSTTSNSKAKQQQKIKWEVKKQLVKNRILALDKNPEESAKRDKPRDSVTEPIPVCNEVEMSVMDRAMKFQAKLLPRFPAFLKPMLRSHVTGKSGLGIPVKFCREHMRNADARMVLVNENKREYNVTYLLEFNILSGGWRGFATTHKLVCGDVLIFQLIRPSKFKVYIIRARKLPEDDKNAHPQNLLSQEKGITKVVAKDNEHGESKSAVSSSILKQLTSFDSFTVHIDGQLLGIELPVPVRKKYYELCCSQNTVLHENLVKGLEPKLVAGMVSQTVGIAGAVRGIESVSDTNCLDSWDQILKAFKDLGMEVEFIRNRIRTLLGLCQSQATIKSKEIEKGVFESKIKDLRMEVIRAEVAIKCLDDEIECLKKGSEELEAVVKDVASTSW